MADPVRLVIIVLDQRGIVEVASVPTDDDKLAELVGRVLRLHGIEPLYDEINHAAHGPRLPESNDTQGKGVYGKGEIMQHRI